MTIVVILVIVAQVWTKEPSAANWINGIAATLSGLNVALTFFILRAALGQLDVLHQDMNNQETRHREALQAQEQRRVDEAEQARAELARQEKRHTDESERAQAQLANAQAQLVLQTNSVQIAQASAIQAQREAAKTRLDLTAPRCSIELTSALVNLYRQGSQEPQQVQDEDLKLDEDVNKQYLEVILTFTIKNWGREPIIYSLGSPWENTGSHILYPDAPLNLWWKYRTSVDHWMRISQGEASIYRSEEKPDGPPNLITLWVPVNNLDNTVNDMHKWDSYIMPITVNRLSVVAHPGAHILRTTRKITYFEREWIPLREEKP